MNSPKSEARMPAPESHFERPVGDHMVASVHTTFAGESIAKAYHKMEIFRISALPVVNDNGMTVGVISRTDLIEAGRVRLKNGQRKRTLDLPEAPVRELMHTTVDVVSSQTPLREAAHRMERQRVHRLYVVDDGFLRGVLSTRELMRAVADAKIMLPIRQIMSSGVVSVRASDPLSLAVDRMVASHRHGLVVVEQGWPVGMFTQAEALLARDALPERAVDEWMDPNILCLPLAIPAHRAAQQAHATGARAVLAVNAEELSGIVTGLDFAKAISKGDAP